MLSNERIREIRERAEKATPGEWEWEKQERLIGSNLIKVATVRSQTAKLTSYPAVSKPIMTQENWYVYPTEADMDFIAHARQDIPDLLQEREALMRVLSAARGLVVDDQAGYAVNSEKYAVVSRAKLGLLWAAIQEARAGEGLPIDEGEEAE